MQRDKEITYMFIKYIHQTLLNEKKKYIRNTNRKKIDVVYDEKALENLQSPNNSLLEVIDEVNYVHLENYISDVDLSNSIGMLSDQEKYIVFKKFVEGVKDTQLAKEFGISSQAVSKKKRNILKKLKLDIQKE